MDLGKRLRVKPGTRVALAEYDPDETHGYDKKDEVEAELERDIRRLNELQYVLFAENKRAVLVVLQAMDTGGKDGTIRHVMTGLDPQGCRVKAFKVPSAEELDHDYLWRVHPAVPPRGEIGIFNRSHYEDVAVVRVHKLVAEERWKARYRQINEFERYLTENDVVVLKFFLHISKGEQKKRVLARVKDPERRWKLTSEDFAERKHWNAYQRAYEDALTRCSTDWAPWYLVPANKKWFRNLAVARVLVETLESMDLKFPKLSRDLSRTKLR